MGLKCGIVGLPNVGKSTLFNAISGSNVVAANYPFATIEPNVGVVAVPDKRIDKLAMLVNPKKVLPATIEFVDIAGLIQGASKGEGLGNQFLANIREVDAIIHVIRCFDDPDIVHVSGSVDPVFDKDIIDHELQLKDLETIKKRLLKVGKNTKGKDKKAKEEYESLLTLSKHIERGCNIRDLYASIKDENSKVSNEIAVDPNCNAKYQHIINSLHLLTSKPVLYVANVDEDSIITGTNKYVEQLKTSVNNEDIIVLSASLEFEIAKLIPEDRILFFTEYNIKETGLDQLIKKAYKLLNMITYFTVGPSEIRAWTIPKDTKAPQAAGVIHSDFEQGFIKAEVITFADFIYFESEQECKKAGKVAIQGKDYIVQDGDIMHFRFGNINK